MPFLEEHSVSEFLLNYRQAYHSAKAAKKSSKHHHGNKKTDSKRSIVKKTNNSIDAHKFEGSKIAAILKQNINMQQKCMKQSPGAKPKEAVANKFCANICIDENEVQEQEWKKLIAKGRSEIAEIDDSNCDQPIPLTNGDNKTNVRFSQINTNAAQDQKKKAAEARFSYKADMGSKRSSIARLCKENAVHLDLTDTADEIVPKVNSVLKFPSFNYHGTKPNMQNKTMTYAKK